MGGEAEKRGWQGCAVQRDFGGVICTACAARPSSTQRVRTQQAHVPAAAPKHYLGVG